MEKIIKKLENDPGIMICFIIFMILAGKPQIPADHIGYTEKFSNCSYGFLFWLLPCGFLLKVIRVC